MLAAVLPLALGLAAPASALEIPRPPERFVYDGAGLLSTDERGALENQVLALDRERGLQVAVAIFPSLEGESLEDFTIKLLENWKPGLKGHDNGALIALFLAEKKIRIEVGYGLEGAIPDAAAGRIIRGVIAPAFRGRQYLAGLSQAVAAIASAARGEPIPERGGRATRAVGVGARVIPLIVLVLFALFAGLPLLAARSRVLGRGVGARSNLPLLLLLLLGSRGGGRGRRDGGFFGGGPFGGGSSGGGGFGGGSFGGGGASGGW